jgi:hypothetical protein
MRKEVLMIWARAGFLSPSQYHVCGDALFNFDQRLLSASKIPSVYITIHIEGMKRTTQAGNRRTGHLTPVVLIGQRTAL